MRFKKSILTVAISTIAAIGSVQAEAADSTNEDSGFISGSSLTATYRQDYWVKDGRGSNKANDGYKDWLQGVRIDFKSGYYKGIIGFDYSLDSVSAINVDEHRSESSGHLPINHGGPTNGEKEYNNISGTTQAFLKAKFGEPEQQVFLTAGKKIRKLQTYNDSTSRIARSATTGYDISANIDKLNVYATMINASSPRNQSFFQEDLKAANEKTIDYLVLLGASYDFDNGISLAYEHGESRDYMRKDFFQAVYNTNLTENLNWNIDARYGIAQENGNLYSDNADGSKDAARDSFKSKYYNLTSTLAYQQAYVTLGYNVVRDGNYDDSYFEADHGTFNSTLSLEANYELQDEDAYFVDTGYDFSGVGINGLRVHTWYAKGHGAKGTSGSRHEWGNGVKYAFGGVLKGASLGWYNVSYRDYDNRKKTSGDNASSYNLNKLIFAYNYKFF